MAKKHYRKNKTCLNCNYVVENKFCPNCGQENKEEHKSFHHLFIHFFEDLTHYENSFWKTIWSLIFKPGHLSKEYISGKRMTYLAPVRLYIFMSFITFFLIAIIPDQEEIISINLNPTDKQEQAEEKKEIKNEVARIEEQLKKGKLTNSQRDELLDNLEDVQSEDGSKKKENYYVPKVYKTLKELDSEQAANKPKNTSQKISYYLERKIQLAQEKLSPKEFNEKFVENFKHNIPKALFVYMPIFAFLLWIFQSKKKWFYFDHGIFTLHYFSFLLLSVLILKVIDYLFFFLDTIMIFKIIYYILVAIITVYALYYFFPAHHRFYNGKRISTIIKGIILFFINMFFIGLILTGFALITIINLH